MAVSGESWIMPKGTVAPGNVWPSPPVPIIGSTAAKALDALSEAAMARAGRAGDRAAANRPWRRRVVLDIDGSPGLGALRMPASIWIVTNRPNVAKIAA